MLWSCRVDSGAHRCNCECFNLLKCSHLTTFTPHTLHLILFITFHFPFSGLPQAPYYLRIKPWGVNTGKAQICFKTLTRVEDCESNTSLRLTPSLSLSISVIVSLPGTTFRALRLSFVMGSSAWKKINKSVIELFFFFKGIVHLKWEFCHNLLTLE